MVSIIEWPMNMEQNEDWEGKSKCSEKICLSATPPPYMPHDLTWDRTRTAAVIRLVSMFVFFLTRNKHISNIQYVVMFIIIAIENFTHTCERAHTSKMPVFRPEYGRFPYQYFNI
jgi:hypothetical protein